MNTRFSGWAGTLVFVSSDRFLYLCFCLVLISPVWGEQRSVWIRRHHYQPQQHRLVMISPCESVFVCVCVTEAKCGAEDTCCVGTQKQCLAYVARCFYGFVWTASPVGIPRLYPDWFLGSLDCKTTARNVCTFEGSSKRFKFLQMRLIPHDLGARIGFQSTITTSNRQWQSASEQKLCCYQQSSVEHNTKNNSPGSHAGISCLLHDLTMWLFGERDDWSCFHAGEQHHQHTELLTFTFLPQQPRYAGDVWTQKSLRSNNKNNKIKVETVSDLIRETKRSIFHCYLCCWKRSATKCVIPSPLCCDHVTHSCC